jgi:hypothetical protein
MSISLLTFSSQIFGPLQGLGGERVRLEEPGVEGWIILNWIFRKGDGDLNLIDLA